MSIKVIKPESFAESEKIRAFFTLKNGGLNCENRKIKGLNLGFNTDESPEVVKENRQKLFAGFDIDPEWTAFANQIHSNHVRIVSNGGTFAETDGLITQVPGLTLAIQVADCAAVLISDYQSKTIAAIHAGWRGAAGDIVPLAMEKMKKLGVTPANCKVFISPCISQANFEVGPEVADQFPEEFVDRVTFDKPHIDLKGFLTYQLEAEGVLPAKIEVHADCTYNNSQYYSYRREKDHSGRMMGIIQLKRR